MLNAMKAAALSNSPPPDVDPVAAALARSQFGLALLSADLTVASRLGALSEWLPEVGQPACNSELLVSAEHALAAIRETGDEYPLPSVRIPASTQGRVNISICWDEAAQHFRVVTTPDRGVDQIERLLMSERREKQLLQQQADAAVAGERRADTLYKDAVERSSDLIFRFTEELAVAFANREAARFLGKTQNALIGENLKALFPDAPWLEVAGERVATFETLARNAEGQAIWLEWTLRALGPDGGNEFHGAARDITAARRLRIERERANEEALEASVANERLRIAHDLHDTLVRSIVSLIAQTRLIARTTTDAESKAALDEMEALAREGLTETREAIMKMRATRPPSLDLKMIIDSFAARPGAPKIESSFDFGEAIVPQETEQLFASILREALRNIELHSGASEIRVSVRANRQSLRLNIEDNGVGFLPSELPEGHFGVIGMRERAKLAGANLGISSAPGQGARITLMASLPTA